MGMYEARIQRVLAAMKAMGLEQMIVSDPDSIWYLTGYYVYPFERMLVLYLRSDGNHILFLNKLFPVPEAPYEQVWFSDTDDYLSKLAERVDGNAPLGIDKDWPARFLLPLMAAHPGCRCVVASDCVDDVRACKDETERQLMRAASRINDTVMERAAAFMREGVTEREVADYINAQYAAGTDLSTITADGSKLAPTVSWAWAYEGTGTHTVTQTDEKDTYLGDQAALGNAADILLTVQTTVTQID